MSQAADDGYRHELVPGVKATADAERLAAELAFATARLAELAADPPSLYAQIGAEPDAEEALCVGGRLDARHELVAVAVVGGLGHLAHTHRAARPA